MTTKGSAAKLLSDREQRASDAARVIELYDREAQRILGDTNVWLEEALRDDPRPLPWPLPEHRDGYVQLLKVLAEATVDNVLAAILEAHGRQAAPPPDPADGDFQGILRVVQRVTIAADAAFVEAMGGTGRIALKREFKKLAAKLAAEAALRNKESTRADAFRAAGLSRSAAYRALRRKVPLSE